jgi:predicted aldo/keto reductase-like oxidoreductase
MHQTNRRRFLQAAVASVTAAGLGSPVLAGQKQASSGIATRPLGKTGEQVSIVGLGGYHVGVLDEKESVSIMHEAIDEGMTFFDNAWEYNDGRSEELMGKALATGGWRQKVFLMTKVCARDYAGAREQLEDSLRRMKTDVIDLWQFHMIDWPVDPDWIFDKGAMKCALEAREAGKIRYIGFTGHRDTANHLKMIAKPFEWDTVQMPINVLDAHYRSFQKKVVPECVKRNIGVIGMKGLAGGVIPGKLQLSAEVCRRFALSLPISTLVCGIQSRANLRQDLEMAKSFKPIVEEEIDELLAKSAEPARAGEFEKYKTTGYSTPYHSKQHGE